MAGYSQGLATLICLGIVSSIPISMICLGALHMKECRMQPWIPKFMVVAGSAGLIGILLSMCVFDFQRRENHDMVKVFSFLVSVVTLFNFCWNIAGSVWVFTEWKNWDKVKGTKFGCHNDSYLFTFALLIMFWITFPCQMGATFAKWKMEKKDSANDETKKLDP